MRRRRGRQSVAHGAGERYAGGSGDLLERREIIGSDVLISKEAAVYSIEGNITGKKSEVQDFFPVFMLFFRNRNKYHNPAERRESGSICRELTEKREK